MRSLFLRSGQKKYELIHRGEGHVPEPFLPVPRALEMLRLLGREAEHMPALRRFAVAIGIDPRRRDAAIREQLARWLWSGRLKAREVPRPPVYVPTGEESDAAQPPPPPPEEQKTPCISNPRWSMPRAPVGATVEAMFTVAGFKGGESVKVTVFEQGIDGARKEKTTVNKTLDTTDGDAKVSWSRSADDAQADLEEAQSGGGPVEYRFTVESGNLPSPGESGPLLLTHTVVVDLVQDDEGTPLEGEVDVTLRDALGEEHQAKGKDGKATFEKIVVGPFTVSLGSAKGPRFSELRWSADRAEVGAEVTASFAFEEAIDGQDVVVTVYELNADGTAHEVDHLSATLAGTSGEHQLSWSRSPDEAEADLRDDEREGDTGPLEYRFGVSAHGQISDARSGPLWLTNTVVVELPAGDIEDGEDEVEAVLIDATGKEHRARFEDGQARFEGVVVGPMEIRIVDAAPAEQPS